jgi:hypothetical protein
LGTFIATPAARATLTGLASLRITHCTNAGVNGVMSCGGFAQTA